MLSKEEIEKAIKIMTHWVEYEEKNKSKINRADELIGIQKTLLQYIAQLEQKEKRLRDKLEKDIVNITKTLQDGKHCDDYSRCRLKAYRTKTKEILKLIGGSHE